MKLQISVLTAVVLALGAGFAGQAAAEVIGGDEEMAIEDAVATEEAPSQVEWYCRSTAPGDPTSAVLAANRIRAAAASATADESCSSWYRCRRLDVARVQRSFLGLVVMYKFWHWKRWCWDYPRVWVSGMGTYVTDVHPTMSYRGVANAWEHYDTWCCFSRTSGHLSFRQGHFDNCVVKYGCIGAWYPWVRIHAHGDGSYHYRTGS
jgi:hypothetical protein